MQQCPRCNYYLEPHDAECPRCKRNADAGIPAVPSNTGIPTGKTSSNLRNALPSTPGISCFFNHDVPAVGKCQVCKKDCCPHCLVEVNGVVYCREDAKFAQGYQQQAIETVAELVWYILGAFLLIPFGLTIVYLMMVYLLGPHGNSDGYILYRYLATAEFFQPGLAALAVKKAMKTKPALPPMHNATATCKLLLTLAIVSMLIYLMGVAVIVFSFMK